MGTFAVVVSAPPSHFSPERLTLPHKSNTPAGPTFGVRANAGYVKPHSDSNINRSAVLTSMALAMARMFLSDGFRKPLSIPER